MTDTKLTDNCFETGITHFIHIPLNIRKKHISHHRLHYTELTTHVCVD